MDSEPEKNEDEALDRVLARLSKSTNRLSEEIELIKRSIRLMENRSDERSTTLYKKFNQLVVDLNKQLTLHTDKLESIEYISSSLDETLCMLMLAIKQNENLQPWIPTPEKQVAATINGYEH